MNKEVEYLKEHLYEIYKYKKSMKDLTYDMDIEHLLRTCKALDYSQKEIERLNDEIKELNYLLLRQFERPYAKKWLEEQRENYKKEHPDTDTELAYPDSETIYKEYYRLNNIINEINSIVEYWGYDKEHNDISSFRRAMKNIKDILGSDKE